MLAFAEGRESGDTGNIDLLLKRSSDNGQTWSEQAVVWDDGNNTCGNPCAIIDQTTGRIFLFMTWNLGSDHENDIISKKSVDTRKPYMSYSDDDGITWSEPIDLSSTCKDPDWGWYATGPGIGIQLKSGKYKNRLVIPANHSYDATNQNDFAKGGFGYGAHVLFSDDGGENWQKSNSIMPGCNESQIVELSAGELMMNMRSYNNMQSRAISKSADGGESWSEITHDPQLQESICQASLIHFENGNNKSTYLFSNPAVTSGRNHMTIKTSFDDGSTWPNSQLVYEGPSAYSCLTTLPNGNVGLFFEAGKKSPYENLIFLSVPFDQLIDDNSQALFSNEN